MIRRHMGIRAARAEIRTIPATSEMLRDSLLQARRLVTKPARRRITYLVADGSVAGTLDVNLRVVRRSRLYLLPGAAAITGLASLAIEL